MASIGNYQEGLEAMRAQLASQYEGVEVAGLAIVRKDPEPSVLLARRSRDESDPEDVRETYEFPGGHLQEGEHPLAAAKREFEEEIGVELPEGEVLDGWRSPNGIYQGFVYEVSGDFSLDSWSATPEVSALMWATQSDIAGLGEDLRPEITEQMDWTLVFPETEQAALDSDSTVEDSDELEEPELSLLELSEGAIPVHGVLAPEAVPSGDGRGFREGAMTSRGYRLPFMWQESQTSGGHDGAKVIGSVDRLMRKDGMIHWEGSLMPSEKASEFVELLAFFGRFGVSVDGDKYNVEKGSNSDFRSGFMWFDAIRAAGLTAVSIPAFAEAYVALGNHPDMPENDSEDFSTLVASGDAVAFKRGPGWVTHPKATRRIHAYWTKKGQPGYRKIAWGTPGDFRRARALIGKKIGANSPEDMRYLNQIIARWHHDALGYWPGELDKPGNKTSAQAKAEREARRGRKASWEPVVVASGEHSYEIDTLSASSATVRPPAEYFEHHPDSGALQILDPDANGIRRTFGYAAEWGVCHIGYDGKCVEVPADPDIGYSDFHLGRTRLDSGEYLSTGVITYKVVHRGRDRMLSESPEQAHYDNIENAWAAVRLGEDDRGIWFSGVVLPHVSEEDLVLIEASGQVSGEWKFEALRGLQCVNIPGFGIRREGFSSVTYTEDGTVDTIMALGLNTTECQPSPKDRMEALAHADALARFDAAKENFNGGTDNGLLQ